MSDLKLSEQELEQHNSNKFIREKLAWLHYRMNTMQFYLEEITLAHESRGIIQALCEDLQKKIEAVEPPVVVEEPKDEPKKPYIIDAGSVKAD